MNHFEIKDALESMTLLVDTREQPTQNFKRRIASSGLPSERKKLFAGDYSCKCTLPDGSILDFSEKVVIERKMDIGELCQCFCQPRDRASKRDGQTKISRFEDEFERAYDNGIKVYLVVEHGSWENIYAGKYNSKMHPNALIAKINAFRTRYNMQLDFCKSETTGKLIRDILYRELKEYLEGCDNNELEIQP